MNICQDKQPSYQLYELYGETLHDLYHINSELNPINFKLFTNSIIKAVSSDLFYELINQQKEYHKDQVAIKLPQPKTAIDNKSFFNVINERRSIRNFSGEAIDLSTFSALLKYSCGVTGQYKETDGKPEVQLFSYPNAGGIYNLMTYVSVNGVEGLERGFYYYNPFNHEVILIKKYVEDEEHLKYSASSELNINCAMSFYISGSLMATALKYSDRSYRFMLLGAGHLAQNISLVSAALDLGAVASGGYFDTEVKKEINNSDQYVLYEVVIGKANEDVEDARFL